jgi:hypothetical protein
MACTRLDRCCQRHSSAWSCPERRTKSQSVLNDVRGQTGGIQEEQGRVGGTVIFGLTFTHCFVVHHRFDAGVHSPWCLQS